MRGDRVGVGHGSVVHKRTECRRHAACSGDAVTTPPCATQSSETSDTSGFRTPRITPFLCPGILSRTKSRLFPECLQARTRPGIANKTAPKNLRLDSGSGFRVEVNAPIIWDYFWGGVGRFLCVCKHSATSPFACNSNTWAQKQGENGVRGTLFGT